MPTRGWGDLFPMEYFYLVHISGASIDLLELVLDGWWWIKIKKHLLGLT